MSNQPCKEPKQTNERDFLEGRRLTDELSRPTVWISHSSWDKNPHSIPLSAKQFVPDNTELTPVSYSVFQGIKDNYTRGARLIKGIASSPFFGSLYASEEGTLHLLDPHTLGDNAFEVLAVYK